MRLILPYSVLLLCVITLEYKTQHPFQKLSKAFNDPQTCSTPILRYTEEINT